MRKIILALYFMVLIGSVFASECKVTSSETVVDLPVCDISEPINFTEYTIDDANGLVEEWYCFITVYNEDETTSVNQDDANYSGTIYGMIDYDVQAGYTDIGIHQADLNCLAKQVWVNDIVVPKPFVIEDKNALSPQDLNLMGQLDDLNNFLQGIDANLTNVDQNVDAIYDDLHSDVWDDALHVYRTADRSNASIISDTNVAVNVGTHLYLNGQADSGVLPTHFILTGKVFLAADDGTIIEAVDTGDFFILDGNIFTWFEVPNTNSDKDFNIIMEAYDPKTSVGNDVIRGTTLATIRTVLVPNQLNWGGPQNVVPEDRNNVAPAAEFSEQEDNVAFVFLQTPSAFQEIPLGIIFGLVLLGGAVFLFSWKQNLLAIGSGVVGVAVLVVGILPVLA